MRIQLLLLSLTIAFASNLACQGAAGPHVETKYLIELPEAFVKTLNTDDTGKANLWHPKLTLTKVHSIQNATKVALQEKKANNPAPAFSSFLQIQQSNTASDSLTYIPGGEDGTSVVKSSKMACGCRFVKDPNGASFIQTDSVQTTDTTETTDNQLQAATSFIEKVDKEVFMPEVKEKSEEKVSLVEETSKLVENNAEEKAKDSSVEEDPEIKALLEKKERMKKMEEDLEKELAKEKAKKEEEKMMLELLEKEEKSKKEEEDRELAALLEKKKLLEEIHEEEEAFREKMRKKEEEEQELMRMLEKEKQMKELNELEKMREFESGLNENSKIAMLLEKNEHSKYDSRDSLDEKLYRDEILAELGEKEPRHKDDLFDKFQLFDDMPESRHEDNHDDMEDFLEFTQRYQQYKSMLTQQQSKQKNRRWDMDLDSYGNNDQNDRDLEDYELLKKIKSVQDKSLREELIEALLK